MNLNGRTIMNMRRYTQIGLSVGAIGLAFGIGTVVGQQVVPTENRGVQTSGPVAIDLAPWADDMKGRQLRIRKLTMEPGGAFGIHSHDDRPDASYLVQGTLTEYRVGGYVKERSSDTMGTAGKGVTHWVENKGTTPAVLIVVDVFKQP
jgi:quercetin dioxygenase-like cupin family protein